ncbi:MAG: helix-turn-helix domain-containing protein [Bacteroidetes bacterium]|nr:helix-turn-helix domain-containing protein [Bacteroidota bacterium]
MNSHFIKMIKYLSASILFLAFNITGICQSKDNYTITSFGSSEMHNETSISYILEDSLGYIWLASAYDVLRFNGSQFSEIHLTTFEPYDMIIQLLETGNHILAVQRSGKINLIDKFNPAENIRFISAPEAISTIKQSDRAEYFFFTRTGYYKYKDDNLIKVGNNRNGMQNQLSFKSTEGCGFPILISPDSLKLFNQDQVEYLGQLKMNGNYFSVNTINGETFLICDGENLLSYSLTTKKKTLLRPNIDFTGNAIIRTDKNNRYWLTNANGLYLVEDISENNILLEHFISDICVSALMIDHNQNIWVGTNGNGLMLLKKHLFTIHSTRNGLPSNLVYPIFEDEKSTIWAGSSTGVAFFKDKSWREVKTVHGYSIDFSGQIFKYENVLRVNNSFHSFILGNDGFIESDFAAVPHNQQTITWNVTSDNNLWICTFRNGLFVREKGEFRNIQIPEPYKNYLLTDFYLDNNDVKWISTRKKGVLKYDDINFTRHDTTNGLISNHIFDMTFPKDGTIWMGTNKGICYTKDEISWTHLTTSDGLSHNMVYAIFADNKYIYAGTHSGFSIFDGTRFTNYFIEDGLPSNEFNGHSIMKSRSGEIWFGTANGVVVYNPDSDPNQNERSYDWQIRLIGNHDTTYVSNKNLVNREISLHIQSFPQEIKADILNKGYANELEYCFELVENNEDLVPPQFSNSNYFQLNDLNDGVHTLAISAKRKNHTGAKEKIILHLEVTTPWYWKAATLIFLSTLAIILIIVFIQSKKGSIVKRNATLPPGKIDEIYSQIQTHLKTTKSYINPRLSLGVFAEELQIPKEYVSQAINSKTCGSFSDYISDFRIEEVKKKLIDPKNDNISILEMAFASGFNSKSTFNLVFKKKMNLTPTEYRDNIISKNRV